MMKGMGDGVEMFIAINRHQRWRVRAKVPLVTGALGKLKAGLVHILRSRPFSRSRQGLPKTRFLNFADHPIHVRSRKPHIERGTFAERRNPFSIGAAHCSRRATFGLFSPSIHPTGNSKTRG
ncbi:unannotated protein [freshwater metagenome]|uniref:Unannotated protein n=1 Tax=freshwater metagenome TaxID=449393 RepID=A0A6J7GLG9_9ZZZZ